MRENPLSLCIEECQKSIDAAQKLIDMCSLSDLDSCAKQVGIVAGYCERTIERCKEAIKHLRKLQEQTHDEEARKKYQWAEKKCQGTIDACKKTVEFCKKGEIECIDYCLETIKECQECSRACNEAMKIAHG